MKFAFLIASPRPRALCLIGLSIAFWVVFFLLFPSAAMGECSALNRPLSRAARCP